MITLATIDVWKACRLAAAASFTALNLSGPVKVKIREGQASPYAKIGSPFEVVDGGDFSDGDGFATRVTMPITFYTKNPYEHLLLAKEYIRRLTSEDLSVPGFNVYLNSEITAIPTQESDTDGSDVYGAICDAVLTVEPAT